MDSENFHIVLNEISLYESYRTMIPSTLDMSSGFWTWLADSLKPIYLIIY